MENRFSVYALPSGDTPPAPRVALYSHDTMGLGHVRRNLLIAGALAAPPLSANVLLIAGVHTACGFTMPPGVDCLTLPAYRKTISGTYTSRSLDVEAGSLTELRSRTIAAALTSFAPDLFIVDNVPRGALGELTPVLDALKREGRSRCVLGLRDVLDEPHKVHRQWTELGNEQAIRDYYDAIWIYGDDSVYDACAEYSFAPDILAKTSFTGYLDQAKRLTAGGGNDPDGGGMQGIPESLRNHPFTLCAIGGGQDGAALARAFAEAELPPGEMGVLVTGPFLPSSEKWRLNRMAAANPRLKVLDFVSEPIWLMRHAERVIAMGGYNTVMEILSLGKRALVVPRSRPRLEQTIRARRLKSLGLLDCLESDRLTPEVLSSWLKSDGALACPRQTIDLGGLTRLPELAGSLLEAREGVQVAQGPDFPLTVQVRS